MFYSNVATYLNYIFSHHMFDKASKFIAILQNINKWYQHYD